MSIGRMCPAEGAPLFIRPLRAGARVQPVEEWSGAARARSGGGWTWVLGFKHAALFAAPPGGMGCLECVLKSMHLVDLTVAVVVCAGTAYSIWHLHNESPPWVYGPILAASGLFAFSTLLSWLTLSCHLTACAWMINVSIITDIVVAVGAAVFGTLLLTQFDTVKGCECPVRISA